MYADTQETTLPNRNDLELIERFIGNDAPQRLQWLDRVVFALVRGGRLPPPPDTDVQLLMNTLNLNRELPRVLTAALDPMGKSECVAISQRLLDNEALHPVYAIPALAPYIPLASAERQINRYAHFAEALADAALDAYRDDLFALAISQQSFKRRLIFERVAREIVDRPDKAAAALRFSGSVTDLITAFRSPSTMREPAELFNGLVEVAWLERDLRPLVIKGLEGFKDSVCRGKHAPWSGLDEAIKTVRGYR